MTMIIEVYTSNGKRYVWIGCENGTGAEYEIDNGKMTLGQAIDFYYKTYKEEDK